MRFEGYISEGRSVWATELEAISWMKKNYVASDTPIFRGVEDLYPDHFYMVDPSKHDRVSRNTDNYYTLLIDNSPNWTNYPKRSKSIICSTDEEAATAYGAVFRIIPKKGSRIGVCNDSDFWLSFRKLMHLEDFNYFLSKLFTLDPSMTKEPGTYQELTRNLRTFDEWVKEMMAEIDANIEDEDLSRSQRREIVDEGLVEFITEKLKYHPDDIDPAPVDFIYRVVGLGMTALEAIEEGMEPERNKFKVMAAGNFKAPNRNEVWTDGKCLMVPEIKWRNIYI